MWRVTPVCDAGQAMQDITWGWNQYREPHAKAPQPCSRNLHEVARLRVAPGSRPNRTQLSTVEDSPMHVSRPKADVICALRANCSANPEVTAPPHWLRRIKRPRRTMVLRRTNGTGTKEEQYRERDKRPPPLRKNKKTQETRFCGAGPNST